VFSQGVYTLSKFIIYCKYNLEYLIVPPPESFFLVLYQIFKTSGNYVKYKTYTSGLSVSDYILISS